MGELHGTYQDIAEKSMKTTDKAITIIKNFMPFILLILDLVVTVVTRLFSTHLENPFTPDFFIDLATNIFTTMFCYTVFVKYGEQSEKALSATYLDNLNTWGEKSGIVRQKHSDRFIEYCAEQVEIERRDIRHTYIINHTMITIDRYKREFEGLTPMAVDSLVSQGKITRSDAKWIKKANIIPQLKPIKPILILCGVQAGHINDVGRESMSYTTMAILSRPIGLFVFNVIITMISGHWAGITSASVFFDIVYSVFSIVLASIVGYSTGASAAEKDMDRIKGRIYFLERFLDKETQKEGQSA